ncbi:mannosyl-oligosaccharide 1,2-alpha-mannosidase MNS3-like protein, partial [Trifolium pratense]
MIVCYFFIFQVITQSFLTSNRKRDCISCSTGKFLFLILIFGVAYLMLTHDTIPSRVVSRDQVFGIRKNEDNNSSTHDAGRLKKFWRRAPRLPPQLPPDTKVSTNGINHVPATLDDKSLWITRQQKVKEAFTYAWSGYKKYAMGYDELMPVSQRGIDGLGGLGATVVDALDTAMIMGIDEVVAEAGSWVEEHLAQRISEKGQVNLFETTIRVLGGLLSAYHLSGGEKGMNISHAGPNPSVYLETAKNLGDRLLSAFTSSPTPIPFSDVVLHDSSAHPAPGGLSSTSEVSTLQLEFNYLSSVSGDPKYGMEAMKVMEHIKSLPKIEGLVPIYISPDSGQFIGQNIRLGSRGDSYYEYLLKVWLQSGTSSDKNISYLYDMYKEAMNGVRHRLVQKTVPNGLVFVGELPAGKDGAFSPKMDHLV